MLDDPTAKTWEVSEDRERIVIFLHKFLTQAEEIASEQGDGYDPDEDMPGIEEIQELARMALLEFAGTGRVSNYAETVLRLCVQFSDLGDDDV